MDRTIWWSQEQPRTFDIVKDDHDTMVAAAALMQDAMGGTTTVVSGLAGTQTGTPSLSINIAAGRIYQLADADAVADGAIPQDLTQIFQQGFAVAQQVALSTTGIGAGQSRWSLIQAQFSQVDSIRSGDPNGGLLYFYNSTNPTQPYQGPGNSGSTTPTVRQGVISIQVVNGAVATTGSEVPPSPTSGWVPLYLIDLTYGQTAITTAEILTAGPSAGINVPSNYTQAPFLAGLLNQHHKGILGQAPKIDLTSEVQGILPTANGGTGGAAITTPIQGATKNLAGNWVSNTTATFTADQIVLQNTLYQGYLVTSYSETLNTATSGAGGLDTGTLAATTWYNVFAIYNATTTTTSILMSLSATAPTLPSGYTYFARIGTVYLDGSKNIVGFIQKNRKVQWVVGENLSVPRTMATGTATAWTAVSTSGFVPPTSISIRLWVFASAPTTNTVVVVAPNDLYSTSTRNNWPLGTVTPSSGSGNASDIQGEFILESVNVYWYSQDSAAALNCLGYEDNL